MTGSRTACNNNSGSRLEQINSADLIQRVDQLASENQRLQSEVNRTTAENEQLKHRLANFEDDLAAARTSLRRVIRSENRGSEP